MLKCSAGSIIRKSLEVLDGGKRVAYGARVVTKGGIQSVPKACFPGGVLLGCSAGLVNLAQDKRKP